MTEKIEIDINKLANRFKIKLDLNEKGNFTIENTYGISKQIIEICLYSFELNKENIAKEPHLEELIRFMYHYQMDEEIEQVIEICLKNERDLKFYNKLEKILRYKEKLKAKNNPKFACERDLFEIFKMSFLEKRFEIRKEYGCIVAKNGNVEFLEFLRNNGWEVDPLAMVLAAENGNLKCIQYLHKIGCHWDPWTPAVAAENGHIEVLKFCYENGCSWNKSATENAAKNNHLEILKFLWKNSCPWDEWAPILATKEGNFDCVSYLIENGCPWDKWAIKVAEKKCFQKIVEYLRSKNTN